MTRILLLALALLALSAPVASASSLVDVPISGPQTVSVLERLGLDVTHDVTPERARVVLRGENDRRLLAAHGFVVSRTVVPDIEASLRRTHARRAAGQRSALPSGRNSYRVISNYYADLEAVAQQHPGLVRKVLLPKQSYEGRDLMGVEIASTVNATDDGRPVAVFFGIHHAREWPSGEVNMEFALDLARNYGTDPRITQLLDRVRVFIFPVINPDGFVVSRGVIENAPSGVDPLHRRNCRPATPADESKTCADRNTVDLNRNYGAGWGGPGASTSVTSDSYRGPGPFSENESQAVHEFSQRHQVMHVQSTHNIVGWVLRQPGFKDYGELSPDEHIMKPLGDAMAAAAGYESLLGYDLYDVHGATEDWNYIEQGAMGYTIELGPTDPTDDSVGANRTFFGPYQTHVVDQYLGGPAGGPSGKGIREAFLLAAEQAGNAADHGVLEGAARPGHTLRVRKDFTTDTARRCPDTGSCNDQTRLPVLAVPDFLDTTLTVPESGRFEWHVGPSTRPWEAAADRTESWVMTCEAPEGAVVSRREIVVKRGERLTFADACDAQAPVTVAQTPAPGGGSGGDGAGGGGGDRPGQVPQPPRSMRLFVGPRSIARSVLRRRGYLRVAMKVRGASVTNLRLRLVNRERVVVASRTVRRLSGRRAVRLKLGRRVPPKGVYRLLLRGTADNGAPVTSGHSLRIR